MHTTLMCLLVLTLLACDKKESRPSAAAASKAAKAEPTGSGSAPAAVEPAPPATENAGSSASDGADEVAQMVVHDVGSKALGNQKIDPACVSVLIMPSGDWTIATARLKDCGDKTARSILWIYKRKTGKWTEDYVGQPPKCWKGLPPDLTEAVIKATKIPTC